MDRYRNLASHPYPNEMLGGWADFLVEGTYVSSTEAFEGTLDTGEWRMMAASVEVGKTYRVAFVQKNSNGDILRFGVEDKNGILVLAGCQVAGFSLVGVCSLV